MHNDAKSIGSLKRLAIVEALEFVRNRIILKLGTGSKSFYLEALRGKKLIERVYYNG